MTGAWERSVSEVWISALALAVSCGSLLVAWRSARTAAHALLLTEEQESRRRPRLGIYLVNGYRQLVPERQLFGLLVSVSNPTDIDNS
ncbi:MAG: hypothetical protein KGL02_01035, partial [Acidobacteriota bacterium]|nr:hypothetical protein [Acidobacteriota bacterium]